jgi:hypothetical protein
MATINYRLVLLAHALMGQFSITAMEHEEKANAELSCDRATDELIQAIFDASLERVQAAIAAGANVNPPDRLLLCYPSKFGHLDIVRALICNGAQVNAPGKESPLHIAAENGRLDMVRELLKNNADIDGVDDTGKTPLHKAAIWGQRAVVRELLMAGANPNALDSPSQMAAKTPFGWAAGFKSDPRFHAVATDLLIFGADKDKDVFNYSEQFDSYLTSLSTTQLERILVRGTLDELNNFIKHRIVYEGHPLTSEELEHALDLAVGQRRIDIVSYLLSRYNLSLARVIGVITVILRRFERLRQNNHTPEQLEQLDRQRQPYQTIYALMQTLEAAKSLYRENNEPVTLLGLIPSELMALVLLFITHATT